MDLHFGRFGVSRISSSDFRPYLIIAAVYLVLFVLLFSPWNGAGCDDVFYYSYLSSFLFDGDVDVLNDYLLSNSPYGSVLREPVAIIGQKGLVINGWAIGSSILWSPFYLPVRAIGWVANRFSAPLPEWASDRFSPPYLMAISFGAFAYGFLTLVLIYATCVLECRPRVSICASLSAVLGSPLLAYIFNYSAMSHTQSAFTVALLLYLSIRHRNFAGLDSYLLIAGALGLATLVRWQNCVFGLIPAFLWIQHVGSRERERERGEGREDPLAKSYCT